MAAMTRARRRIAVLGDGGWGTTLALHLHRLGHDVRWWSAFPAYVQQLTRRRVNVRYLPGIRIPSSLYITSNISEAVAGASIIIIAIPSQHVRQAIRPLSSLRFTDTILVSATKGLERTSLKRMTQVIAEELGHAPLAVLSGPNVAVEIAQGHPASSVVASATAGVAARLQTVMMDQQLRIYTSDDPAGVELGGALKNPIAIAAGIGDGLGFGANAKAALVTRGVVEMTRLGVAMGARAQTFWGLSGLGDLVTTCLSGRNRWLGEQLGRGKSLKATLASTPMVIEGVETSAAAVKLGRLHQVELPIIEQIHAILFRGRSPRAALHALMSRPGTRESLRVG